MIELLAFDYGASSGRTILGKFDGNKLELEELHRFSNDPVTVGKGFYWDILRLYHEMKQGMHKAVSNGCKNIKGIGVDTWGVDFGLLDSSGELLSNPRHYRDEHTNGMIEKACEIMPKKEIYMRTGIQFLQFNTLYQLLSLRLNNPGLLNSASKMLLIPDLLNYFLTGIKSSEFSIASTTQMYNHEKESWDFEMLEKMGIPTGMFTEIRDTGTILGNLKSSISDELGIGEIPVISVAEHDTGSAVVSVPSTGNSHAYLSSGTWSLLGVQSESPVINDKTYMMDFTNEGGINRSTRLLKNIMGLWIYQECIRSWNKEGNTMGFDELESLAINEKPFRYFIDPDNAAFLAPGRMPEKVRDYCKNTGQYIPESKPEIVRCIMESLALKYRAVFMELEDILSRKLDTLHIIGGGCKNKVLCQFTANSINRTVLAGPVEATSIGNIITQLIALGEISNLSEGREVVKRSFNLTEYKPKDTGSWDEAYERFTKLTVNR